MLLWSSNQKYPHFPFLYQKYPPFPLLSYFSVVVCLRCLLRHILLLIKTGVTLCFQFVSVASASAAATAFASHVKTIWAKNLRYLAQRIYGSGEMYWMTFPWPWPAKICLARDKVRTTHGITTKHGSFIALVMVITWLGFGEVLLATSIWAIVFILFRMCFFKVKHYFGHISGMVGPIDVKRKGSASVGYWSQYVTCITIFDLTYDLDLGCFKVKFRKSSFSGIVGLIDVKWKRSELK